jgi:hypothetical protein
LPAAGVWAQSTVRCPLATACSLIRFPEFQYHSYLDINAILQKSLFWSAVPRFREEWWVMTKFTIVSPQVVEETSGRLVLTPKRSTQIWAVVILLMVLFLGLAIAAMGWFFDSVCTMVVGVGPLLLGVLMIARNPILVRLTIDDTRRQLAVEQTRLIGLGFLPRRQVASFGLDQVTSMELTENMLSTGFGVKIEVGQETAIILNTRRDGRQASMLLDHSRRRIRRPQRRSTAGRRI